MAISVTEVLISCFVLALLRAVTAASLLTTSNTECIASTADDLVAHTRQIANTTAADKHDRVFLKVVAFARDVNGDFFAVRQPHAGDLPESRVRLLRRHRAYQQAHTALLRALIQNGRLAELPLRSSATADKLVYCGHSGAFCRGKRAKSVETNKFTPLRMAVKGGKLAGERLFFNVLTVSSSKPLN